MIHLNQYTFCISVLVLDIIAYLGTNHKTGYDEMIVFT